MNHDQFSATVHRIYAAATDFSLWVEALSAIEELTGSTGAVIDFIPKTNAAPLTLAGRFSIDECREYSSNFQRQCPRIGYAMTRPDLAYHCDAMVLTESEMDRNLVYDWFGKHGLRYYVGSHLPATRDYAIYWSLQRSPKQGHVQADDLEIFLQIKSHLAQAIALAERVGTLGSHWTFSAALLDRLPHAVFLLKGNGELLFANAAGEVMLSRGDALQLHERRIMARHEHEQAGFDSLLASSMLNPFAQVGGRWMRLSREFGLHPYVVFAAPLALQDGSPFATSSATVVVVHDLTSRNSVELTELKCLYDLTQGEARVAHALATGHDIESASALIGISPATTRTHLKAVFRKMGINRQQELVRILTGLGNRF